MLSTLARSTDWPFYSHPQTIGDLGHCNYRTQDWVVIFYWSRLHHQANTSSQSRCNNGIRCLTQSAIYPAAQRYTKV